MIGSVVLLYNLVNTVRLEGYLCDGCSGVLDGHFAVVGDGGPDGDGLAGDVTSAVQPDPTGHWTRGHAGQPDAVLDLAVERLLEGARMNHFSTVFLCFK